ncbi:MAG: polysaccharide deacetylase family protein [Terrisporobacter sp.]|uniref:polysaccharide deacetylase family protein n=1 Tax=Terrisporobacter sp. TaxID=1965305 RepID=UPI002FC9FDB0
MNSKQKRTKAFILSFIIFFGVLLINVAIVFGVRFICSKIERYEAPINRVNTEEKQVALTFDVAWGSKNIEDILDILDKHNVKVTFFLVGSWVDDNEDLVKEIYKRGHEIGNHSNTHSSFIDISQEAKEEEITTTSEKIKKLTGEDCNLFRPPFGNVDMETIEVCKSLGYYPIKWDVDSGDWKDIGPVHIIDRVVKNTKSGSIILFHANVENVDAYLDEILTNLDKRGYSMVKVSDLIYKDNYSIDTSGEQKLIKKD